jgi:single-strand DNA-binding protein
MPDASVSFAGNITDQPEVRHTDSGVARATFRVAVSGRSRDSEASFFTVVVWRDQAEHAAESLSRGSRIVVMGRLQQRTWTAEDGSARQVVEVVTEELGPSLRWATATPVRASRSRYRESLTTPIYVYRRTDRWYRRKCCAWRRRLHAGASQPEVGITEGDPMAEI